MRGINIKSGSRCVRLKGQRGFTLLELMVTISVAAILAGVAIPSYRSMVQRNAIVAQVNTFVNDLYYARNQAVDRGTTVYLCKSSDQDSCTTTGDWSKGWIVYAPSPGSDTPTSDNILRVHRGLGQNIAIKGDSNTDSKVAFDANGFAGDNGAIGNGTLTASADSAHRDTRIIIAKTGRIHTEKSAAGSP